MTASYDHPPKPPDPWQFEVPLLATSNKIGGYPEAMFSVYCFFTVLVHMWFYNLVLKSNGLGYEQWIRLNFKLVVPSCLHFQVSSNKDNPPRPSKSKASGLNLFNRRFRLATFAIMNAGLGDGELFGLKSNLQLRRQLQCYRSKVDGSLDVAQLPDGSIKLAFRSSKHQLFSDFSQLTNEAPNAFAGILDTGASWNAINNPKLCIPGSVHQLEKPIILDDIAGGLPITKSGRIILGADRSLCAPLGIQD
jgi:hypothetical protein